METIFCRLKVIAIYIISELGEIKNANLAIKVHSELKSSFSHHLLIDTSDKVCDHSKQHS